MSLRILQICPYYSPATVFGGIISSVRSMTAGLTRLGCNVEIYTTSANYPKDDPPREGHVDGVTVKYHRRYDDSLFCLSPSANQALLKYINRFDLLHIHGMWNYLSLSSCLIARSFKKPYVMTPHGALEDFAMGELRKGKEMFLSICHRQNLKKASFVHCLSEQEKNDVLNTAVNAETRIIPNSLSFFDPPPDDEVKSLILKKYPELVDKDLILFMSRIHPKKGLDSLIKALFLLTKQGNTKYHLVIAGPEESDYSNKIRRTVSDYQLDRFTTFTGLIEGVEKSSLISMSRVFALPSHSEGLPMAALEAMHLGVPVVISENCNLTTEIQSSMAGLICKPDPISIRDCIKTISENEHLHEKMGKSAQSLIKKKFDPMIVGKQLKSAYEFAIENSPKSSKKVINLNLALLPRFLKK